MEVVKIQNSMQNAPRQDFSQNKRNQKKQEEAPEEVLVQEFISEQEYQAELALVNKIKTLQEHNSPAWKYLQLQRRNIHKVDLYDIDYVTPFPPPKPVVNLLV